LQTAIRLPADDREQSFDHITMWLRTHAAQAAKIWAGWGEVDGRLVRVGGN
jgi:inhibitor of KinA sporulation pathway (predicted exonuclease)